MRQLIDRYGVGDKYLDVGCGTGLILRHLPSGSVGIDLNARHLEKARKYVPEAKIQLGDAEKLEFDDESFSTVVCTEVLEHLVHSDIAVEEIKRVIRARWSDDWVYAYAGRYCGVFVSCHQHTIIMSHFIESM